MNALEKTRLVAALALGILGIACGLCGLPWACLSLTCCACWFGWQGREPVIEAIDADPLEAEQVK